MRTAVTLLTTLATVFHFAVGCCLHASHAGGAAACCHGAHVECHAGDGCDGIHGHDHGSPPASLAAVEERGTSGMHGMRVAESTVHACDGCTCVVTVEPKPVQDGSPSPAWPGTAPEADSIVTSQAVRGPCDSADAPTLSVLRPPLFERLLV